MGQLMSMCMGQLMSMCMWPSDVPIKYIIASFLHACPSVDLI